MTLKESETVRTMKGWRFLKQATSAVGLDGKHTEDIEPELVCASC